jgi:hypothetical protein
MSHTVLKNIHFGSTGNSIPSKICRKKWVSKTKVKKIHRKLNRHSAKPVWCQKHIMKEYRKFKHQTGWRLCYSGSLLCVSCTRCDLSWNLATCCSSGQRDQILQRCALYWHDISKPPPANHSTPGPMHVTIANN